MTFNIVVVESVTPIWKQNLKYCFKGIWYEQYILWKEVLDQLAETVMVTLHR